MPLSGAIPIIFGANIGTAATALFAAIGQNAEALRVAAAHAAFKVVGVILFVPFAGLFTDLVAQTAPDVPRQIANAHTLFNVILAAVFLPFTNIAADLFTRLVPDRATKATGAIYLNPQTIDTPAVALGQALRETLRMGDVVLQSLRDSLTVLEHNDEGLQRDAPTEFLGHPAERLALQVMPFDRQALVVGQRFKRSAHPGIEQVFQVLQQEFAAH